MLASKGVRPTTAETSREPQHVCKPDQLRILHIENPSRIQPARLRLLAGRLHALGPRPLFEYLAEVIAGADGGEALERYARLAPLAEFIAANGGDRLPSARLVSGGRR
jgi:hypothetical protein